MSSGEGPRRALTTAAVVLQALVLGVLYLPAGLVVPPAGWVVLNAVGIALAVVCVRLGRQESAAAVAVPVASALFWVAFVIVGGQVFGWTA